MDIFDSIDSYNKDNSSSQVINDSLLQGEETEKELEEISTSSDFFSSIENLIEQEELLPVFVNKLQELEEYQNPYFKKKIDIFSSVEIKRTNIFSRLFKSFNFLVWGDV